jgi:hypothetical protein
VAGITRRDLLRFAGLAAVLAACGSRRPTSDPQRAGTAVEPAPDVPRRGRREPPTRPDVTPPEPRPDAEPDAAPADGPPDEPPDGSPAEEAPAGPTRVEVVCRDAWGATQATPHVVAQTITGLMVHHSAVVLDDNRLAPERIRRHQRRHQAQGWADIAYHLAVDRGGHVYELRDPRAAGETGTPYDPSGWLLVMAEGNFDEQEPTPAQLDGIARVLAWGAATYGVDPAAISTHRHHVPTTRCPGEALFAEVVQGRLTARVTGHLDAGGVELTPLCGAAGAARVAAIESGTA